MKSRLLAIACGVAAISIGAAAQADVIAGWDFSQYEKPGSLDGGGSSPVATNADSDPNGAGAEAAAIGQAIIGGAGTLLPTAGTGQNGTQATPEIVGYKPRGPIASNAITPFLGTGKTAFDSFNTLEEEGQAATNHLAMVADGSVVVDFEASDGLLWGDGDFAVSFGGKMLNGGGTDGGQISCGGACTTMVDVSLSTDGGASFEPTTSVVLTPEDQRFEVPFPGAADGVAVVARLSMTGSAGTGLPVIDNVAITATPLPEPGALAGLAVGALALAGLRRGRR